MGAAGNPAAPTAEAPSVPGVIALEWADAAVAGAMLTPEVAALSLKQAELGTLLAEFAAGLQA